MSDYVQNDDSILFKSCTVQDNTLTLRMANPQDGYEYLEKLWKDNPIHFAYALGCLDVDCTMLVLYFNKNNSLMDTLLKYSKDWSKNGQGIEHEVYNVKFTVDDNGKPVTAVQAALRNDYEGKYSGTIPVSEETAKMFQRQADKFLANNNEKFHSVEAFYKSVEKDIKKANKPKQVER